MIKGKFPVPPTLADMLDHFRLDSSAQLRVAIPGEIVTYNATNRTAEIKVCYNRVYNDGTVKAISAPLVDVPIFTLQGGGIHVGMPIEEGDECWVFFADINIDSWHANRGQQTPLDKRRHDIADGFAFVGPNSLANLLVTALGATEGGLSGSEAKVAIDKATQMITVANTAQNLKTSLTALLTTLSSLTAAMATEGAVIPISAAAAATTNTAIAAVQVQLDALLY